MRRAALAGLVATAASMALVAPPSRAATPVLGPLLRVTTPESTLCPAESEPEVTVTRAGTWVAYNDDGGCPLVSTKPSFTTLQLVRGGRATRVSLPPLPSPDYLSGDPDLAPDVTGDGVLLSTLRFRSDLPVGSNVGGLEVEVYRVSADGRASALPPATVSGSDDKEFLATDRASGTVYLAWDDVALGQVLLRAYRAGRWGPPVVLSSGGADPDVAVGPHGEVAVAYETEQGVAVRVSHDHGRTFSAPVEALTGSGPGRADPSCPLRPTIGNRQRAIKSPRVAYDRAGALHVVASLGGAALPPALGVSGVPASPGVLVGGEGTVQHAVSRDGRTFTPGRAVAAPGAQVQWNPALAPTPDGGMAVSFLQTAGTGLATYDARVVLLSARGAASAPLVLSSAAGPLPPAQEALGNSNCYGIGDYTGLAPTPTGVVAVWPTTVGSAGGAQTGDSDIALRTVSVR